jgi:hypothetical protein
MIHDGKWTIHHRQSENLGLNSEISFKRSVCSGHILPFRQYTKITNLNPDFRICLFHILAKTVKDPVNGFFCRIDLFSDQFCSPFGYIFLRDALNIAHGTFQINITV